ncbi:hypothetical protein Xinn_02642 [Xenorhabdus innexi]|uniref:Uncharacterized protein n=1 Tax=Xenorhabdus innexi TaxID=290109 RepID=A0A2G0NES5_9GAMM|nr:hypothetical protein Xinn_02642 [Xenorhabdus innexi]
MIFFEGKNITNYKIMIFSTKIACYNKMKYTINVPNLRRTFVLHSKVASLLASQTYPAIGGLILTGLIPSR